MVTVKLYGILRDVVQRTSLELDPSASVHVALRELCSQWPKLRPLLFDPDGDFFQHIVILLDGKNVWSQQGLQTKISEGSTIALVYPIEGG